MLVSNILDIDFHERKNREKLACSKDVMGEKHIVMPQSSKVKDNLTPCFWESMSEKHVFKVAVMHWLGYLPERPNE